MARLKFTLASLAAFATSSSSLPAPVSDTSSLPLRVLTAAPEHRGASPSFGEFSDTSTATSQLKTMVAQTVKVLQDAGIPRDDWERILTIASIVEGEVIDAGDDFVAYRLGDGSTWINDARDMEASHA